jgi:predicted nuclease of predicted toxin-antitoxin system
MRILADENFPHSLIQALRLEGHDVLETGKDLPSRSDKLLLELAEDLGRIVFTLDKDFWHFVGPSLTQNRPPNTTPTCILCPGIPTFT